jgi:tRNA-Thr(GGU) m(6)t(6)A37 methyltransferase TsaA
MEQIIYNPIGIIYSPFKSIKEMPIQPIGAVGIKGKIEIKEQYREGLKDLEGFSHIILIYHFHLSQEYSLKVVPFIDNAPHGVFATRAPKRPNSLGLSIVRLTGVEDTLLHIENIDIVDGTPLLDIKPYVPQIDAPEADKIGWLSAQINKVIKTKSDLRFR